MGERESESKTDGRVGGWPAFGRLFILLTPLRVVVGAPAP